MPAADQVNLRVALDLLQAHPEILKSKHYHDAIKAYDESVKQLPAAKMGKGRRATHMLQGDMFGIQRPSMVSPQAARQHTDATTRVGAWEQVRAKDTSAKELRMVARKQLAQAEVVKPAEAKALKAQARGHYSQAKKLED